MSDLMGAAQRACLEIGLIFQQFPSDGLFHPLAVVGKTANNGAGRINFFTDGEGGQIWNHITSEYRIFWAKGYQSLSPSEQADRKQRAKLEHERAEKNLTEKRKEAAKKSLQVFRAALPATDNSYLIKKGVTPTTTLVEIPLETLVSIIGYHPRAKDRSFSGERILIVPVRNHEGMTSIEMIDETGLKAGLYGGLKKGCFWPTGRLQDGDGTGITIGIGEGVATLLTYHKATANLGIAALSCGNIKAVAILIRDKYPSAKIVIISDIGTGEAEAVEAALIVKGILVKPTLPEGSKGTDINDMQSEIGIDEVRRQIDAATKPKPEVIDIERNEPLPLLRINAKKGSFPISKLPAVIRAAAARVQEVIQAPMELVCQSFLAAITLATQPLVDVLIDGRQFPVSNNFIALGVSGERKSAVDNIATGPIKERQQQQTKSFNADKQKFEAKHSAWESQKKQAFQESDADVIEAMLHQAGEEPKHIQPCHLFSEPSFQGIERAYAEGRYSLGLFSDEGGKFVGGYAMSKENQVNTITGLSKLWDGAPLDRLRGGDGLTILYGRRFSIHLMMQPILSSQLFGNSMISGQGFLSRCLCCWPESTIGLRPYKAIDLSTDESIQAYNTSIKAILDLPEPMNDQNEMGLEPRALTLTAQAKATWIAFHDDIETAQIPGGELSPITGFASKTAEHAARIAGVLTAFKNPEALEIDTESIEAGIAIAQYYLGEALRLFHSSSDDPLLTLAEECFRYGMEKTGGVIGLRNLYQCGPNAVRSKEKATRIMQVLESHYRANKIKEGAVLAGSRNRDAWQLVPLEG